MVQDMHNPEFFYEKFEIKNEEKNENYVKHGKYRDSAELLVRFDYKNKVVIAK